MHVEQLPYDYPLRPNFQRLSDYGREGPFNARCLWPRVILISRDPMSEATRCAH